MTYQACAVSPETIFLFKLQWSTLWLMRCWRLTHNILLSETSPRCCRFRTSLACSGCCWPIGACCFEFEAWDFRTSKKKVERNWVFLLSGCSDNRRSYKALEKDIAVRTTFCAVMLLKRRLAPVWRHAGLAVKIESSRLAASYRGISRLGCFFLKSFKLAHICIQVTTLHMWDKLGICWQIFWKSISRNATHEKNYTLACFCIQPRL